jgi:hypothetical protein
MTTGPELARELVMATLAAMVGDDIEQPELRAAFHTVRTILNSSPDVQAESIEVLAQHAAMAMMIVGRFDGRDPMQCWQEIVLHAASRDDGQSP